MTSAILEGTIANINNKYVILNDKHYIQDNFFLHTLLPNDIVKYFINEYNQITIVSLEKRETQYIMGIIKSIDGINVSLFCPGFPKFFSPSIHFDIGYELGTIIILKVAKDSIEPVFFYDSIKNRKNDKELILQLYKLNTLENIIMPDYKQTNKIQYTSYSKDLTHLDTFNVDPPQSKDFDDAISIEDGKIYVHIVDAHSQIIPHGEIDIDALNKSFTLYLPEHIENILPQELSEQKLSLVKDEERKVITIEMRINQDTQEIMNYDIYPSIIKIKNRYNYEDFGKIVDHFPSLVKFNKKWAKNTLNIPHLKLFVDDSCSRLKDFKFEKTNDIAHKIVETLMIATNLIVSKHVNVPQRYHNKIKCEFETHHFTGNEMIDAILTIKKYKPAIYDSSNEGHFGLGLKTYTHFTSPIRRYFDVIVHRLLAGTTYNNLDEILNHINKRETYIENLVKLYENFKILDYLERNSFKIWNAYIINVTNVGVNVLIEDILYELFIFVPPIKNNYNVADSVKVQIKSIDWLTLTSKGAIV